MHDLSRTVVAVATPPGRGGVGCVRVSGPAAIEVGQGLFRAAQAPVTGRVRGRARFGTFLARGGQPLDHGYLVLFGPDSAFTGEPTAELWPHGSPTVLAELVEAAVQAGAVPAEPGEFTYRALRSGRIDLPRAEAVRDLVESRTLFQARVAFAQAEGALSRRLAPLRESLEEWIARSEAAVEFVDESETHLTGGELAEAVGQASASCRQMLAEFRRGRVVRDGASLVMVGLPNAGKSSLFNRLLERDRAIVAEVAGTTRDTLEESLDLDGIPVRVVDTAGLRDVQDPVESEGVRRAEQARREADLELLVLDGSRPLRPAELAALECGAHGRNGSGALVVLNKSDLERQAELPADTSALDVSARTGDGLEDLRHEIRARLVGRGPLEDPILTNARHARALEQASGALEQALAAIADGLTEDLVVEDLRAALRHLGEITGEFTNEQLYDRIFSTFCIGK